jgi:hypothetical protein
MIRGLLLVAPLLLALGAAPAEARRFHAYVACGVADSTYRPPPSHSCPVGDLPHAVLIDRERSRTRYRLCIRVPSGTRYCRTHHTGASGRRSQRALHNEALGRHVITWYFRGTMVQRWTLQRTIGD